MMVKTLSKYDFINKFKHHTTHRISYSALSSLYDYYEDYAICIGEPFERHKKVMYLIDICCGFTEYNTIEEAAEAYSISPIALEDATMVLHVLENGHVVVQKY